MAISANVKKTLANYNQPTNKRITDAVKYCRKRMNESAEFLLTIEGDTKTVKGSAYGVRTGILYLAPASQSGVMNVCAMATEGCKSGCLFTAGRGQFDVRTIETRIRKTIFLNQCRQEFVDRLRQEIARHERLCIRDGVKCAVRVNGTSDLPWLSLAMAAEFPNVQFYDYTKFPHAWTRVRPNYSLTFSHSESNESECLSALAHGVNVAVVFDVKTGIKGRREAGELPATWNGYKVVDGDVTDLRFLDASGVVVGLRAKGQAKKDVAGFVVKVADLVQISIAA